MIQQNPGIIYLNQERIHHENEVFRTLKTLEAASQRIPSNWQSILSFEENTLAGQSERAWYAVDDSVYYWIPLVGTLEITDANANVHYIEPGSLFRQQVQKGESLCVYNAFAEDVLIQYLQIVVRAETPVSPSIPELIHVEIRERMNELVELHNHNSGISLCMGLFSGRSEALIPVSKQSKGVFCYIIQGAFEVQYRLLEKGDGLALWDIEEVDMEALSENAIMLLLEVRQ